LWKRFDDACNEAHKVVEAWLEKLKAQSAEHRAQRLALIEELNTWAAANRTALDDDWKGFNRILHQFGDRWRDGGHVGEKVFAELQPLWKAAIDGAAAPLEALQANSLAARQLMIEEARALGSAPELRIDAVRGLQQRWQAEAHRVPVDRRQEQKLWEAFRQPIDEAFNRKTTQRQQADAALGERDRVVLDAARSLEAANLAGDAQGIRAAMSALEAALRGQAQAQAAVQVAVTEVNTAVAAMAGSEATGEAVAQAEALTTETAEPGATASDALVAPEQVSKPAAKPVRAVRGDDRPGMKKTEPAPAGRGGKFGERKDGARDGQRAPRDDKPAARADDRGPRRPGRDERFGSTPAWQEAPRLGDTAFRAQRDAVEHAQFALRKLAAQAHGEALTQVLAAWERRDATLMPSAQELGSRVPALVRAGWLKAIGQAPGSDGAVALLRLEMASEMPTPAEHLNARRALQLQLLTKRHDPAPAQTWGQDAGQVLASAYDAVQARRLQNVLKVLLKPN
jgi:hypothetical protein